MVLGRTQPVFADTEIERCSGRYVVCYVHAAIFAKDFWDAMSRFFDCELQFVDCARPYVLGR